MVVFLNGETEVTRNKDKYLSKKGHSVKELTYYSLQQPSTNFLSLLKCKPLVFIQTLGYKVIIQFIKFYFLKLENILHPTDNIVIRIFVSTGLREK